MIGEFIYYHDPLYGWFHQYGVIVYELDDAFGVSMPKFNGDYLYIQKTDPKLVLQPIMTPEHRVSVLSNFGPWW